jgi:hypothetical protein
MELTPSDEQWAVILAIVAFNVICQACAGAGKSSTMHMCAKHYPASKFLILTYNCRLKEEMRERVKNLDNVEIHTFHSFCVKYMSASAHTDEMMLHAIREGKGLSCDAKYDFIFVDEAQDCTKLYRDLVEMIPRKPNTTISIFGDRRQLLYDFKGADSRFLTMADRAFSSNGMPWKFCELTITYRMSKNICSFVNDGMLKEQVINTRKRDSASPKVLYHFMDPFAECNAIAKEIVEICKHPRVGPGEVFVLNSAVRSPLGPSKLIAQKVKDRAPDIPIFLNNSDTEPADEKVVQGKLTFSTFHSAKGLERKVVFVLGFDDFYFELFKGAPRDVCPPPVYVAATRAKDVLTVYNSPGNTPFKFMDWSKVEETCEINGERECKANRRRPPKPTAVTDLIKFKAPEIMLEVRELLKPCIGSFNLKKLESPPVCKQGVFFEQANDITGNAVTKAYQTGLTNAKLVLEETLTDMCRRDNTMFRKQQFRRYDWVDNGFLEETNRRISMLDISPRLGLRFEELVETLGVIGFIDIYDPVQNRIVEIKAKENIDDTSIFMQTFLYAFLAWKNNPSAGFPRMEILNVLDGTHVTLHPDTDPKTWEHIFSVIRHKTHEVHDSLFE